LGAELRVDVPWKGKRAIEDGEGVLQIRCVSSALFGGYVIIIGKANYLNQKWGYAC
jgi:hypothetical protein